MKNHFLRKLFNLLVTYLVYIDMKHHTKNNMVATILLISLIYKSSLWSIWFYS